MKLYELELDASCLKYRSSSAAPRFPNAPPASLTEPPEPPPFPAPLPNSPSWISRGTGSLSQLKNKTEQIDHSYNFSTNILSPTQLSINKNTFLKRPFRVCINHNKSRSASYLTMAFTFGALSMDQSTNSLSWESQRHLLSSLTQMQLQEQKKNDI